MTLLFVAACGAPAASAAPTAPPAANPVATVATIAFPIIIENCGRTLTFAAPPERVVSLWQPPNELLLALGVQEQIGALAGNYTDLRPDLAPRTQGVPIIGENIAWPSREVLLSQEPDLVIAEGVEGFAFDSAQGHATAAEIEATGVQVLSTGGRCTPTDPAARRLRADRTLVVCGDSPRCDGLNRPHPRPLSFQV
jgi:iron complex transport system substrate-binding protein